MSQLAFLKTIQVVPDDKPIKKGSGGVKKEWNPPTGLTIRVWKDGSIFPSQELTDKFQLEYLDDPKLTEDQKALIKTGVQKEPFMGNGFDVADTKEFPFLDVGGSRLLIISPVAKTESRVDIFDSVVRNKETGKPTCSVMDQGSATFGKNFLIPRIEEVYGIVFAKPAIEAQAPVPESTKEDGTKVPAKPGVNGRPAVEGVEYVDMVLLGQGGENSEPWTLPAEKPLAFFPKVMTKGDAKGQMTAQRRERPEMYVFYPKSLLESSTEEPVEAESAS